MELRSINTKAELHITAVSQKCIWEALKYVKLLCIKATGLPKPPPITFSAVCSLLSDQQRNVPAVLKI